MKTKIEITDTLYRKACKEAQKQNCTIEEWLSLAIERQVTQTQNLRSFVAEKSKGASKEKALAALKKIGKVMDYPPVEGDELINY